MTFWIIVAMLVVAAIAFFLARSFIEFRTRSKYHPTEEPEISTQEHKRTSCCAIHTIEKRNVQGRFIAKYKAGLHFAQLDGKGSRITTKATLTKYDNQGNQIYWAPTEFFAFVSWSNYGGIWEIRTAIKEAIRSNPNTLHHGLIYWVRMRRDVTDEVIQECFDPLIQRVLEEVREVHQS